MGWYEQGPKSRPRAPQLQSDGLKQAPHPEPLEEVPLQRTRQGTWRGPCSGPSMALALTLELVSEGQWRVWGKGAILGEAGGVPLTDQLPWCQR